MKDGVVERINHYRTSQMYTNAEEYKNKIILREAIILCFNYSFFSIDLTNFDK